MVLMFVQNAVILSAGRGSRLLPLTQDRPKCLIPVGGRAILDHQIDALAAAGVARTTVVGGYLSDRITAHLAGGTAAADMRFNPFWAVSSSIGSVWTARDLLHGDFAIVNGDTVYRPALIREGLAQVEPGIALFVEPAPQPEIDDMRVAVTGGMVRAVGKTLDPADAPFRSLGIVVGRGDDGRYRRMLDAVISEPDGIQSFHHRIVHELAQAGPVQAVVLPGGGWVEIDRPEDIANWAG
ncbi:nucleotidyltransferase [Sphingomonas prati]|nr:nucleotidyltransferase [Sphingomonas prati]